MLYIMVAFLYTVHRTMPRSPQSGPSREEKTMPLSIFITGASGEIGSAAARRLKGPDRSFFLVGFRNEEALEELVIELREAGCEAKGILADLSTKEGCDFAVSCAESFFGTPDILINAAGMSLVSLFQDSSDEELLEITSLNLLSAVRISKAFVPGMVRRRSGRILNVASVWGETGASTEVEYSMTKGGLIAFTRALAKEIAPSGIAVNAVSPGAIDTKMNAHLSEEELMALADEIPMGRLGTPEEVGDLIALLLEAPLYLTGQTIRIDGGWI